ncbi:hypothetical protein CPC16_003982 [Podila verticillata]|nr:hypothetical protein CPC16_003982 [Podila verticillata]KFH67349.1 hypothetical protein MVEG_06083 [Podila verticillata NRRL 6337]
MSPAAWKERTYINTTGHITLTCDRIIFMDGAEKLRVHLIRVTTKTDKDVTLAFEDANSDEYAVAQGEALEPIENVEVIKEAVAAAFSAAYRDKKKATEKDDATKED